MSAITRYQKLVAMIRELETYITHTQINLSKFLILTWRLLFWMAVITRNYSLLDTTYRRNVPNKITQNEILHPFIFKKSKFYLIPDLKVKIGWTACIGQIFLGTIFLEISNDAVQHFFMQWTEQIYWPI